MGMITMANSAAAALLSLQMMGAQSGRVQGLKRRVLLAEEDDTVRVRSRSNKTVAAAMLVEELCLCDVLPVDVLAQCLSHLDSFQDMASASRVCKHWREGIRQALACQTKLSFAGWRPDDATLSRLVEGVGSLKELNLSNGRWGCRITDEGLLQISLAKCCPNLTSISLWGVTAITDAGVVNLVTKAVSLEHFNVGGTFITDISILAVASYCKLLKVLHKTPNSFKCMNLWCCRHVTVVGLLALVEGCPDLESINVWGMSISLSSRRRLKQLNPKLQLKPLADDPA